MPEHVHDDVRLDGGCTDSDRPTFLIPCSAWHDIDTPTTIVVLLSGTQYRHTHSSSLLFSLARYRRTHPSLLLFNFARYRHTYPSLLLFSGACARERVPRAQRGACHVLCGRGRGVRGHRRRAGECAEGDTAGYVEGVSIAGYEEGVSTAGYEEGEYCWV